MSTERKPGSRGVRGPFSPERANQAPRSGSEPGARKNPNPKGSTRTVSPRKSFKRRPSK
jgi:hypothetical protein